MSASLLNEKIRKRAEKLNRQKIFPAFVSGAEYNYLKKVAPSGDIELSEFVKPLKIELQQFGKIGSKYKGSSIGFCAETVSANKILQRFPTKLKQIVVGVAIRPKTLQKGKMCKICKSLF